MKWIPLKERLVNGKTIDRDAEETAVACMPLPALYNAPYVNKSEAQNAAFNRVAILSYELILGQQFCTPTQKSLFYKGFSCF